MTAYAIPTISGEGQSVKGQPVRVLSTTVDFSETTNAAADTFDCLNIVAGSVVLGAGVEVQTVDSAGNSGTLALAVDGVANVAAAAPTSLGQMTNAAPGLDVVGTSDATARLTVATGAINAVVRVWVVVADPGDYNTQTAVFS